MPLVDIGGGGVEVAADDHPLHGIALDAGAAAHERGIGDGLEAAEHNGSGGQGEVVGAGIAEGGAVAGQIDGAGAQAIAVAVAQAGQRAGGGLEIGLKLELVWRGVLNVGGQAVFVDGEAGSGGDETPTAPAE